MDSFEKISNSCNSGVESFYCHSFRVSFFPGCFFERMDIRYVSFHLYLGMIASGFNSLAAATLPTLSFFLADDHGQADSGPYGSPDARTPNIEKLASEGMTFTQAFVASPSCAPSRTAMLTGLMPARNGAEANHTFKRDEIASLRRSSKSSAMKQRLWESRSRQARCQTPRLRSFQHEPSSFRCRSISRRSRQVEAAMSIRRDAFATCSLAGKQGFDPAKIQLPASSVDTPETRVQRARYLSGVADADKDLGEILAVVEKYTSRDNTLTIYTADHGAQWPFGKWNLYDSGIRVPFIARWPGRLLPEAEPRLRFNGSIYGRR